MALINVPPSSWCLCQKWRLGQGMLENHDKMNFCPFCGEELVKSKEEDDDDERTQHIVPRRGYYWVPRLATPEHLTVFHLLKDGTHAFLCGMEKSVGAEPAPNIPSLDRCCRDCVSELRKLNSE